MFVYESVPGTAVFSLKQDGSSMEFEVEGAEDAQITVEMEADTEYSVSINGEDAGKDADKSWRQAFFQRRAGRRCSGSS